MTDDNEYSEIAVGQQDLDFVDACFDFTGINDEVVEKKSAKDCS